jgi:hypothetical protein
MRDGIKLIGKKVHYNKEEWTIKDFFFVPDNPEVYVRLSNNLVSLNVRYKDLFKRLQDSVSVSTSKVPSYATN